MIGGYHYNISVARVQIVGEVLTEDGDGTEYLLSDGSRIAKDSAITEIQDAVLEANRQAKKISKPIEIVDMEEDGA